MSTNYQKLTELKQFPLGMALLDRAVKELSANLTTRPFESSGEIATGLAMCKEQSVSGGCANCPVSSKCNHTNKDGFIAWLSDTESERIKLLLPVELKEGVQ